MNLLPVATPAAPANVAGSEDPGTTGSGDFTALLAMLVGAASTTLPIGPSPDFSGDTAATADPSTTPVPTVAAGVPAPDLAAPALFGTPNPPVGETIPVPIAERADAPVADASLADAFPAEVVDSPVPAVFEPSMTPATPAAPVADAATVETPRRRADPPRAQPAAPAVPAHDGQSAIPADRAVPAQPAVAAPQSDPSQSQPVQGSRPRPAELASPATDAEVGVALEGAATPAVPAAAGERERRPETLTLPEVAHFDRPPLGDRPPLDDPSFPTRDPGHGADRRPSTVQAVPPFERTPVDLPPADQGEAFPVPKAAGRPPAPAGPPGAPTQVVPLVAANRSNTLAPVDEAPAAAAAPATVPEQIVSAVVPLHGRGDGRHEVTLELRPDNLGTIRVEVVVEQQTVHLTLHAAEPATSRLLSTNLPDLRSALTDAGLTAGQVGVGVDGSGAGHRRPAAERGDGDVRRPGRAGLRLATTDEPTPVRPFRPAAAGRLDLFL